MCYWNSSLFSPPFCYHEGGQPACLLLDRFAAFCFKHTGSRQPFISEEDIHSFRSKRPFLWKQSIMEHRSMVDESRCPFLWKHISNNLEANIYVVQNIFCNWYKWIYIFVPLAKFSISLQAINWSMETIVWYIGSTLVPWTKIFHDGNDLMFR